MPARMSLPLPLLFSAKVFEQAGENLRLSHEGNQRADHHHGHAPPERPLSDNLDPAERDGCPIGSDARRDVAARDHDGREHEKVHRPCRAPRWSRRARPLTRRLRAWPHPIRAGGRGCGSRSRGCAESKARTWPRACSNTRRCVRGNATAPSSRAICPCARV